MTRPVRRPIILGLPDTLPASPFATAREMYRLAGSNSGNLAFTAAIRRHLVGWGDPANLGWNATPEQIRTGGDICVIPGANKLGRHTNLGGIAGLLERVEIPIVAISLGAQSDIDYGIPEIPEGTLRWVKAIADRAPSSYENIGVRGEFTRRVLHEYGFDRVRVLGCPSLFLNPSAGLGRLIEGNVTDPPSHVAVAAGGPKVASPRPHRTLLDADRHGDAWRIHLSEPRRDDGDSPRGAGHAESGAVAELPRLRRRRNVDAGVQGMGSAVRGRLL